MPPRNVGVAAIVRALEAHLLPHAHRHRGWAPLHPQGLAPGAQASSGDQEEKDGGRRALQGLGTLRHLLPVGWLVWVAAVLGYQIPPRLSPKPRPTSCPALRRWASLAPLLGSLAGGLGGSPWWRRLQAIIKFEIFKVDTKLFQRCRQLSALLWVMVPLVKHVS